MTARDDNPIVSSYPQRQTVEIHIGHYDAMCNEIDRLRTLRARVTDQWLHAETTINELQLVMRRVLESLTDARYTARIRTIDTYDQFTATRGTDNAAPHATVPTSDPPPTVPH